MHFFEEPGINHSSMWAVLYYQVPTSSDLPFPASFKATSDGVLTWRELYQSELITTKNVIEILQSEF